MPTSFQDLAQENLEEIIKYSAWGVDAKGQNRFDKTNLCNLRLVSSCLNPLVSRVLFASLHLQCTDAGYLGPAPHYTRCHDILVALVTRSTTVFEHTRKLTMRVNTLFWTDERRRKGISETRKLIVERINDIITGLKNLEIVEYHCDAKFEPKEPIIDIMHALAKLPSFRGFDALYFVDKLIPPPFFTLQPLSNLTVFRTFWKWHKSDDLVPEIATLLPRCPHLVELSLGGGDNVKLRDVFSELGKMKTRWKIQKLELCGLEVTPDDIRTHLNHFENLSYLEIQQNLYSAARTTLGTICTLLREGGIFLKGVSSDIRGDPLLLTYLCSYSGLKKLSLVTRDKSGTLDQKVVECVYSQILPNHSDALEDLKLGTLLSPDYGVIPTREQFSELVKCRRLKSLHLHKRVDLDRLRGCESEEDLDSFFSLLHLPANV